MDLEIKGFIETSFLDWDGKVCSTLYVPHCNFHCPFCHNSGLIEDPKQYETIPAEKIEKYLLSHKDFIDGICLTGGEPCLHKNRGLFEFLRRIKDLGFGVKFDSNGTDPDCLKKVIEEKLADYIAMDIKGPLDERYDKLSGIKTDLTKIKESIKIIMGSGLPYEFRTTIVPGLLGGKEMEEIAKEIAGAKKFVLQQFVAKNCWDESFRDIKHYERKKLEELRDTIKPFVKKVLIRGE
ncbi:anaerobic ribonucleoside-triphosphate reductase activating protein [candidate division WOR-1 bacterium RIFOXYA12_FULL_43_27]|uniref:Anaerobic ribonucleoside-triphosphate reductase activating protein n=1 Tax=candidate division WOR-1 bacterium RIFOXYC2_FULL_46_14 TaxID=1802587 RepID=A0A1F4U7D6_UNCSA|nr:MAG: anaerobic ribonucleoside-triphosphate reductase activating protein [candidate division WOR-1 bacterium RIFOXYA12_FULL_43_27]OGC19241.1 MAG: anaerobic ribonucleoside-triphosphate reductase activating protein [candidate division WOR-1 bacterium RIFOXYB2_FULL_46_45]OGC30230.1 MAG: anaerobic ribonucleoside-triphosphate reductase activating protein [candidate division WOR-1 bacterium RIFOXYA2_FULL_46_56]OGC40831.1 MAG: anaerobic ribonucleoside-triphosphate reductase activating protein [candid